MSKTDTANTQAIAEFQRDLDATVAIQQPFKPFPEPPATNLLTAVERAASSPSVDVTKLRELIAIAREERAYNAEIAFNDAMVRAQAEIGRVHADRENPQTRSMYATYASLDRAVRPAYVREGFSLSFNTGDAPDAMVRVLCYVSHKDGHTRTYQALIPADGKGAKGNDVMTKTHATGSALSYGKRYLLKMVFNIAEGDDPDDDDGNGADHDTSVFDAIYDKIDLCESIAELQKTKPEIEQTTGKDKRNLIVRYNAKLRALRGEPNANA